MDARGLRGQLGVKSGPLAPTSAKLSSQMMVVDHMNNHYKKIAAARGKGAIDNAPPKSMMLSQKMRDRQARKYVEKNGYRPPSRTSSRMHRSESAMDGDIYDEQQWGDPEDDEAQAVHDIMRKELGTSSYRVPLKAQHDIMGDSTADGRARQDPANFGTRTMRPHSASLRGVTQTLVGAGRLSNRPMSARSTTSLASNMSQTSRGTNPLKVTYDGDVINKHAHFFTETAKPFTPRTLKSNRESSLKRYKYYTPPPEKKAESARMREEPRSALTNGNTVVKDAGRPQVKPRRGGSSKGDLGNTETLTESMLMEMSLQSHGNSGSGGRSVVPRLDITLDKDHMQWVEDQATRAKQRVVEGDGGGGDTLGQTGTLGATDTLRFTRTGSSLKSSGAKSPTSRRLGQAQEEQMYVTFAQEVTNDIASRGISSDRVMQQIFEKHIDRNKDKLDERRLRAIIGDIRSDLGVVDVGPVEINRSHRDEDDLQGSADLDLKQPSTTSEGFDTMGGTGLSETGFRRGSGTMTSLSDTRNTYEFDRTTDVLSTIRSVPENNDSDLNQTLSATQDDLSASQTIKQYRMTLTQKDEADDDEADSQEGGSSSAMDSTMTPNLHNGDQNGHAGSSEPVSPQTADVPRPAARARRQLQRQDASIAGHENGGQENGGHENGGKPSPPPTESKMEEEVEEEVEEDYEDDYDDDADDDDDDF